MSRTAAVDAPGGLIHREEFLSIAEEALLLAELRELRFDPIVMHGQEARRTARHFGLDYDYGRRAPKEGDPLPDWLESLRNGAAGLAGLRPDELLEVLVQRYPVGSTIGWHRDAPAFGVVVGVSLGGVCRMRFRLVRDRKHVWETVLERRSAYVLAGAARWSWQHSIPATSQERFSITFRSLR
jgi:alkylated DNA repair protein (DNA oxidative demethylase)